MQGAVYNMEEILYRSTLIRETNLNYWHGERDDLVLGRGGRRKSSRSSSRATSNTTAMPI